MAEPPLLKGAIQFTVMLPLPRLSVTVVGAPGAVAPLGVTLLLALEALELPLAFVATTVNV